MGPESKPSGLQSIYSYSLIHSFPPSLPPSLPPPPSLASFLGLKIAGNFPLKVSPLLYLRGRIAQEGPGASGPRWGSAIPGISLFLRAAWAPSHLLPTHLNMFRTSVLPHTSPGPLLQSKWGWRSGFGLQGAQGLVFLKQTRAQTLAGRTHL